MSLTLEEQNKLRKLAGLDQLNEIGGAQQNQPHDPAGLGDIFSSPTPKFHDPKGDRQRRRKQQDQQIAADDRDEIVNMFQNGHPALSWKDLKDSGKTLFNMYSIEDDHNEETWMVTANEGPDSFIPTVVQLAGRRANLRRVDPNTLSDDAFIILDVTPQLAAKLIAHIDLDE